MKNFKIPDLFYYPALALIIIASFMSFSPVYFPFMDTATALSIIMTPGVSFPGELYLWGQNFSGTFIPDVANLLHVIYRFPPDLAVSVVTWIILTAGFLSVSTLLRSRFTIILLCLVWFFPPWYFTGHLTTVFGMQMSFTGIMIYLLNRFYKAYTLKTKLLWLSAFCLSLIISVWISDLALLSVILLVILELIEKRGLFLDGKFPVLLRENFGYLKAAVILAFTILGTLFLFYAKMHARDLITYSHPLLNDPASILKNTGLIFTNIFGVLWFRTGNITAGLYGWSFLIGIPLVVVTSAKGSSFVSFIRKQKWMLFFSLNAVIILTGLILSGWVFANGAAGKYFTIVFLSIWIVVLMMSGTTESGSPEFRRAVLIGMTLMGVVSSLFPLWFAPGPSAAASGFEELKRLNAFGIIGESSLVYAIASTDPNHIRPLPHEGETERNPDLRKEVFRQHTIYLLKENWLETFPDTISQYGVIFQRTGTPVKKSGLDLCRYEQYVKRTIFPVDSMKFQGVLLPDTTAYSGKAAMITIPFDRNMHFIYGPFINLEKGNYTAIYRLKISRDLGINNFAVLNISYNYGKDILTTRTLRLCEFERGYHFEEFDLPFEAPGDLQGVEFRIMYLGESDLYFDRVILIGK